MNKPDLYEIRVAGHLSQNWAARFEGLSMRQDPGRETVLTGLLDQAALHGVFLKIRDLGLNLISVNPVKIQDQLDGLAGQDRDQPGSTRSQTRLPKIP